MESLSLAENDEVDDETLLLLCNSCVALRRLNVSLCDELTDAGLAQVVADLDQLEYVDVTGCRGISGRLKKWLDHHLAKTVEFSF